MPESDKPAVDFEKTFTPICPNCDAEGERQRRVRGKWRCGECGETYTTSE